MADETASTLQLTWNTGPCNRRTATSIRAECRELARRLRPGHPVRRLDFQIGDSVEPGSAELQKLIRLMVLHRVALTSTLAVAEGGLRPSLDSMARQKLLLHPIAWTRVSESHASQAGRAADFDRSLKKEMAFEREFVAAGGMLMASVTTLQHSHASPRGRPPCVRIDANKAVRNSSLSAASPPARVSTGLMACSRLAVEFGHGRDGPR